MELITHTKLYFVWQLYSLKCDDVNGYVVMHVTR